MIINKALLKLSRWLPVALLISVPLLTSSSALADGQIPGMCRSVVLPVALGVGQPDSQNLSGTLCNPLYWSGNSHEVDVLVHGATYNRTYWNWPIDTTHYSYVDQTLQAGRAVFYYDAIGSGNSSHPLSTSITIDSQAYALHQAIQWLRARQMYAKYTVVGHSYGSITAVTESAAYHDENELVLTGYSHAASVTNETAAFGDLYPANLDPQFAGDSLDSDYLTTKPGTRGTLFYDTATADPAIIAFDEAHKDAVSSTFFGGGIAETNVAPPANVSDNITVPILEVLGQEDYLYCGTGTPTNCMQPATIKAYDQPYFAHSPSLSVATIPNTGHDLALHPSNWYSFLAINQWINTH